MTVSSEAQQHKRLQDITRGGSMYCRNQQGASQAKAGPALRNHVHGSLKIDRTERGTIEK